MFDQGSRDLTAHINSRAGLATLFTSLALLISGVPSIANATLLGSLKGSAPIRCEQIFSASKVASELGPRDMAYHLEAPDAQATYERLSSRYMKDNPFGVQNAKPLLSIVVPAWKEAKRIPRSIEIIKAFMQKYPLPYEVIIVVERSPDNTLEVAREAAAGASQIQIVTNNDGLGRMVQGRKGFAVRMGMGDANGQYRLFMDADLSTSMVEILRFLDRMSNPEQPNRPQVLIGSRVTEEHKNDQHRTMLRSLLSTSMRQVTAFLGRPPEIEDTQCGFKMFTADAARMIFSNQRENGFAFDVELILLAVKLNYNLQSQPVLWVDAPGSVLNPVKDSIDMVKAMVRIWSQTRALDKKIKR